MNHYVTCTASVMLLAVIANPSAAQQRDRVDPIEGGPVTGAITSVSPTTIELDANGTARRFSVNEIDSVSFADDVEPLRTARSRMAAGQLEEAMSLLNSIPPQSISRAVVREDLEFFRAACAGRLALTGGGDKARAAAELLDFVKKHENSFHYFEAVELIGDLAFAMGRFDHASQYYQKLAEAPWPEYQLRAKVLDARTLLTNSKPADALRRYDEVLATNIDTATALRQKTMAQIGKATCLAELGKPDEGQKLVETVIRDNDPQDVDLFARAYNALGLCHVKANRNKDALLAFLHVDLLFNRDADSHAQALYYLSQLWGSVGRSDRAVDASSLLKSRYAGTVWAAKTVNALSQ